MTPFTGPYQFLFLATEAALGSCWSFSGPKERLDIRQNQDTLALANGSTPITPQTMNFSREINSTLTGLIFALTMITYYLLMKYTGPLTRLAILPAKFLRDNMVAILLVKWPERFIGEPEEPVGEISSDWVIFRNDIANGTLGSSGVPETDVNPSEEQSTIAFQSFSPVMKALVQIAVWNHFSIYLVLVMIINSLLYNGFLTNNFSNDGILRLFLVGIYAVVNFAHQIYTSTLVYRNFSFVLYQSCWVLLCRMFVFLSTYDYKKMTMHKDERFLYRYRLQDLYVEEDVFWTQFSLALFGAAEREFIYCTESQRDTPGSGRRACLKKNVMPESKYEKSIKPLREAEIKLYEKAADSALEKILANVAILLGICFATALAPWTSFQTFNATNAQLGSYALLVSVGAGLLALISSLTQVSNATESAKTLLRLYEKAIEVDPGTHEKIISPHDVRSQREPEFGFSRGIEKQSWLTVIGLWRLLSVRKKAICFLFGPALMLIPRFMDIDLKNGAYQRFSFMIRDVPYICSLTSWSSNHSIFRFRRNQSEGDGEKIQRANLRISRQ